MRSKISCAGWHGLWLHQYSVFTFYSASNFNEHQLWGLCATLLMKLVLLSSHMWQEFKRVESPSLWKYLIKFYPFPLLDPFSFSTWPQTGYGCEGLFSRMMWRKGWRECREEREWQLKSLHHLIKQQAQHWSLIQSGIFALASDLLCQWIIFQPIGYVWYEYSIWVL